MKWLAISLALLAALLLAACADLRYYSQAVNGHMRVMNAAVPVRDILQNPQPAATAQEQKLRERLALTQRMRAFASEQLALPRNASYTRYADIHRKAVVWNVVAAPAYSLKPKTFCFAVMGCVSYKGYYDENAAKAEGARLQAEGFEVYVYGVPAYSTLGYMNWAGGDPLLSNFIYWPEGELARIMFHELAHQVLYVKDDSTFNESFATAVERQGVERWLAQSGAAARGEYAQLNERRNAFRALTASTRAALLSVYNDANLNEAQKQQGKTAAMQHFRQQYAALKQSWNGDNKYDAWVANANNAYFVSLSTYDELVPQFEGVFKKQSGDFARFYQAIQNITHLPKEERRAALGSLATP